MICRSCRTAADIGLYPLEPQGLNEAALSQLYLHGQCTGCDCQHRSTPLVANLSDVPTEESRAQAAEMMKRSVR